MDHARARARPQHMEETLVASEGTTIASGGGLADRYAAALYSHAEDSHALDEVVAQMETLGRTDRRQRRFPPPAGIAADRRQPGHQGRAGRAASRKASASRCATSSASIAANRRLRNLREIVTAFATLVAERRGIITAHVASAHPLNDVQRQQLRARLIEAGYGNVNIDEAVEPDLLGGLVVRVGARLYDTSLKSRLQRLQYAMKGAA